MREEIENIYQKTIDKEFESFDYVNEIKKVIDYFKTKEFSFDSVYYLDKTPKNSKFLQMFQSILIDFGFESEILHDKMAIKMSEKAISDEIESELFKKEEKEDTALNTYIEYQLSRKDYVEELKKVEQLMIEAIQKGKDTVNNVQGLILGRVLDNMGFDITTSYGSVNTYFIDNVDNIDFMFNVKLDGHEEKLANEIIRKYSKEK